MIQFKKELTKLIEQREAEIEDFLEEFADEKYTRLSEIKNKYKKLAQMAEKKEKDEEKKAEKLKSYEDRKESELEKANQELSDKRRTGLYDIKKKYNQLG